MLSWFRCCENDTPLEDYIERFKQDLEEYERYILRSRTHTIPKYKEYIVLLEKMIQNQPITATQFKKLNKLIPDHTTIKRYPHIQAIDETDFEPPKRAVMHRRS